MESKKSKEVENEMAGPSGTLSLEESLFLGSRKVECYEIGEQIGEGSSSQVYRARERDSGEIVALKKISNKEKKKVGLPKGIIREIHILKALSHPNVIKLKEIVMRLMRNTLHEDFLVDGNKHKGSFYMVFEYMEHDLAGLLARGVRYTPPEIKCIMEQLLFGLQHCHDNKVLHRDIKGANILVNRQGIVKLADFGMARQSSVGPVGPTKGSKQGVNDDENLSNSVITLSYRPPELLLGATDYGTAVDMWSVGCVFAQLLLGQSEPLFDGSDNNPRSQLNLIFDLCGFDESEFCVWELPLYNEYKPARTKRRRLRERFKQDHRAVDLLDKMLNLNPYKRISAKDALWDKYFRMIPLPCDPRSLPKYASSHEFEMKRLVKELARQQLTGSSHQTQQQQLEEMRQNKSGLLPPKKRRYKEGSC